MKNFLRAIINYCYCDTVNTYIMEGYGLLPMNKI